MSAGAARRVLILNTDLEIGGTPTVIREIATRLHAPPNVHVEIACLGRRGPVAQQIAARGVHVTALGATGIHDIWRVLPGLVRLIHRGRIDTVFSFLLHANAVAAIARLACPAVRFIQSIQTTQPYPAWHWGVQRLAQRAAERVIVPSPSVADVARRWAGVSGEKIIVIPNGIEPRELERSPIPATDPRPFPIGFVGRLDPVKRLPDLLRAVALLGDKVHLHVFGDGPERPRIERDIQELAIASRVTLHGFVPGPAEALRQIGCLVLPSASEGMPMVLIEAMAAGVPVVGRDVPGVRDLIRDGISGALAPARGVPDLAAAIARVVDDRALRQRMIEYAARGVRSDFTWDRIIVLYREALLCRTKTGNDQTRTGRG